MADGATAPNPRPFWRTHRSRPGRSPAPESERGRPSATPRRRHPTSRLAGRLILVVDDDWDARQIVQTVLEHHGAQVVAASGALEALRLLGRIEPSAVVLDLRMPGYDGFDVIQRIRADSRWARLPVIALTALDGPADYLRTLAHGFDAHLTKPVEDDTLLAVLDRVIREKPKG